MTQFTALESIWQRTGTTISPIVDGDDLDVGTGSITCSTGLVANKITLTNQVILKGAATGNLYVRNLTDTDLAPLFASMWNIGGSVTATSTAFTANSGDYTITCGPRPGAGNGFDLNLIAGAYGDSGPFGEYKGGDVNITGGASPEGAGGNVVITPGTGTTTNGTIQLVGNTSVTGTTTLDTDLDGLLWGTEGVVSATMTPSITSLATAGSIVNTMAAADTQGLIIDGDTNPYQFTGGNVTFNSAYRTLEGTITSSQNWGIYNFPRLLTIDIDYSGTASSLSGRSIYSGGDSFLYSGDITLAGGFGSQSAICSYGGTFCTNDFTGTYSNSSTKNWGGRWMGGYFVSSNNSTINISDAGTNTLSFMGGYFATAAAPSVTVSAGTLNLDYYAGYFEGIGTQTAATDTVYAVYATATGGDTNYGVYSAAGLNYFAERAQFVGGLRTKYSEANVSDPPTDAELDSAFGTPTTVGSGFVGVLDDNSDDTDVWLCYTSDTSWFYLQGTKAV